jgi:hypothetical protein
MYRQYTGIPYAFRAFATGGTWPYTWTISGQPSGMTIVTGPCTAADGTCTDGLIEWASPTAGTHSNIQVCVSDDDEQDCETFSLTVGTSGFVFLDADDGNDTTGSGTLASPWQTISKARASGGANSFVYLRGATAKYNFAGITGTTSLDCGTGVAGTRVVFTETSQPVIFVGYPGETPFIDHTGGGVSPAPCWSLVGDNIYLSNLSFENCASQCIRTGVTNSFGAHYHNLDFGNRGPGCNECNSSAFMFSRLDPGGYAYGTVIQNVRDTDVEYGSANSFLKAYTLVKPVFQQIIISDVHTRTAEAEALIALKDGAAQFTVRDSQCIDTTDNWPIQVMCLGGGMHSDTTGGQDTYGEIYFNQFLLPDGASALFNLDSEASPTIYSYRNTYLGTVTLWNVDSDDGPFSFVRDVIVNSDSADTPFNGFNWATSGSAGGSWLGTQDQSRVTITSALVCAPADGCTDADGFLIGSALTNHGPNSATPKGHMMEAAEASPSYSARRLSRIARALPSAPREREAKAEAEQPQRRSWLRNAEGRTVADGPRQRLTPGVGEVSAKDVVPFVVRIVEPDGPRVPIYKGTGRALVIRGRSGLVGVLQIPIPAELCGHHGHFGSAVLPATAEVARQSPIIESAKLKLSDPVEGAEAPDEQPIESRVHIQALPFGVHALIARRHDIGRVLQPREVLHRVVDHAVAEINQIGTCDARRSGEETDDQHEDGALHGSPPIKALRRTG